MNGTSIQRCGMSLLEIVFAVAILFSVMAAALSFSTMALAEAKVATQDVNALEQIDRLRSTLGSDMLVSGILPAYDAVSYKTKDVSVVPYPPYPDIPATSFPVGSEFRFVRMRTSLEVTADPKTEGTAYSTMARSTAVHLDQLSRCQASPFFILNPEGGGSGAWYLAPTWESNRAGLTFAENCGTDAATNASNPGRYLRIYRYVLVPDKSAIPATISDSVTYTASQYPDISRGKATVPIGLGMLLRQYHNPGDTVWKTTGLPLATGIRYDTIRFSTRRTEPSLKDTEVRLHLELHRPANANVPWPTMVTPVDISAAMQSISYGD